MPEQYSERIVKAFEVAYNAHKGQTRKGTIIPYIVHPMDVASILMKAGVGEEVVLAGLLHDVVEDTPMTIKEVREMFGEEVARLVKGVSEPEELAKKPDEQKRGNWVERKQHTIDFIRTADVKMKILSCADKLSNIRSMIEDYNIMGEDLWNRFNAPFEKQKWYYNSMLLAFESGPETIANFSIYNEFKMCVERLFGKIQ